MGSLEQTMRVAAAAVLGALALAASVAAVPVGKTSCRSEFEAWKGKHGKRYGSAAPNPFSALSWAEFKEQKLMASQNCSATHTTPVHKLVDLGVGKVPDEWDWRNQ